MGVIMFVILGVFIGVIGSVIGYWLKNKYQEKRDRRQSKLSLIVEWGDSRQLVKNYYRGIDLNPYYGPTFRSLIVKTEWLFSDDKKVKEKCDVFKSSINSSQVDKRDLEVEYTTLIKALCNNVNIPEPKL
ncbi:hypothetical protein [uncultured Marinococcus sp.]|uniref:hypothetical protein n=1 Tax=uncultured Marinococcus sp. TaxID=487012 RepID=UPI002605ECF7|nr:hypothetical protein [uncultured Marinococcus sp.]